MISVHENSQTDARFTTLLLFLSVSCREIFVKVVWSIRSFLDYRVPVFAALNELCGGNLSVVFPDTRTPQRVRDKIKSALGDQAIEMTGEKSLGSAAPSNLLANRSWLVTYQPGLSKRISSLKPDVTIGDGFGQWSVPLIKRRIFSRTPFVMCYERTAHTERSAQFTRRFYRRSMCRWVDAACVNGAQSRDYLNSLGIPLDRITTGFMASDDQLSQRVATLTDTDLQNVRQQYNLTGTVFLFVGRLIDRKGVLPMFNAWRESLSKNPDATLAIAGEGDHFDEIQSRCKSEGIDNVRLLGSVPYDQIERLYSAADAMVMPTLEDNWSLVVPEAMSCGLPVLNSKYNGCWPELTIDGKTGWVFDPLDPAEFSAKLSAVYDQRSQLSAMSAKCKEIAGSYTPQSAARAILDACELALS